MLEGKIKSLLRAYKSAKDHNAETGAARSVIPYMKEMDDLFGDRPMMGRANTINVSARCSATPLKPKCMSRSAILPASPVPPEVGIDVTELSFPARTSSATATDTIPSSVSIILSSSSPGPSSSRQIATSPMAVAGLSMPISRIISDSDKDTLNSRLLKHRKSAKIIAKEKEELCRKEHFAEKEKCKMERLQLKIEFLREIENRREERAERALAQIRNLAEIELAERNRRHQELKNN